MRIERKPGAETPYLFAGHMLDPSRAALRGPGGAEAPLRPKSFAPLRHLAEHAGHIVSRDALVQAVWPGAAVSDESITQCIADIRRALGEDGRHLLRTLPKRGYMLACAVSRGPGAMPAPAESAPTLLVLPFANMGGDPAQDYFATGLAEEIAAAPARCHWLRVIAGSAVTALAGQDQDARRLGREFGAHYVLAGSVRSAGGRMRILCHLVEAATLVQVWSDRFDGDLADVFGLQDRVTESVAAAIEPRLQHAEVLRTGRKPTESLDAYDLYLRALPQVHANTRDSSDQALALLRRAAAIDPGFALAKALAGFTQANRYEQG